MAVEGLDGAGKTTVARLLAHALQGDYVQLPPREVGLAEDTVIANYQSLARYLYYLAGVVRIYEIGRSHSLIVADRCLASAHALHTRVSGVVADQLRSLRLPEPDMTIYLDVTEEERKRRLERRDKQLDPFEAMLDRDDIFRRDVGERLRSHPRTYVVDTTGLTPESVAGQAARLWQRQFK